MECGEVALCCNAELELRREVSVFVAQDLLVPKPVVLTCHEGIPVKLYIYNSGNFEDQAELTTQILVKNYFHASVQVCGVEYYFGNYNEVDALEQPVYSKLAYSHMLQRGFTKLTKEEIRKAVDDFRKKMKENIPQTFDANYGVELANEFLVILGVEGVPSWTIKRNDSIESQTADGNQQSLCCDANQKKRPQVLSNWLNGIPAPHDWRRRRVPLHSERTGVETLSESIFKVHPTYIDQKSNEEDDFIDMCFQLRVQSSRNNSRMSEQLGSRGTGGIEIDRVIDDDNDASSEMRRMSTDSDNILPFDSDNVLDQLDQKDKETVGRSRLKSIGQVLAGGVVSSQNTYSSEITLEPNKLLERSSKKKETDDGQKGSTAFGKTKSQTSTKPLYDLWSDDKPRKRKSEHQKRKSEYRARRKSEHQAKRKSEYQQTKRKSEYQQTKRKSEYQQTNRKINKTQPPQDLKRRNSAKSAGVVRLPRISQTEPKSPKKSRHTVAQGGALKNIVAAFQNVKSDESTKFGQSHSEKKERRKRRQSQSRKSTSQVRRPKEEKSKLVSQLSREGELEVQKKLKNALT